MMKVTAMMMSILQLCFAALWILNPKINEDIPIKKETTARIFPVIPGTITNAVLSLFVVVAVLLRYL